MSLAVPTSYGSLEAEVVALRARVAELTADGRSLRPAFGLSLTEDLYVRSMLSRRVTTREQVVADCYSQGRQPDDLKIVDVMVCNIRKKLKPHDIAIETVWGVGYHIPPGSRERLTGVDITALRSKAEIARATRFVPTVVPRAGR